MSQANKPFLVRRTCTRKSGNRDKQGSQPLEAYRDLPAYVLLGDPGAGKTEAFKLEASECGGEYIKARDFATIEPGTEYQGKILFIDALDEMPAVEGDRRNPLDRIRERLAKLGRPSFRLSCREADWLGESGSEALKRVSPNGDVVALHLDPLTDDDVAEILRHTNTVPDPDEFIRKARDHRLDELLRNPQTLTLLVEAVGGNEWPASRKEIYEMACRQLVREKNPEHRQAKREKVLPTDRLLDAAGYLCAIQLLSGIAGYSLDEERADKQYFCWKELTEHDPPLLAALKTNLFQGDGEERRIPIHRSVAEYLGARYLASRIEHHGLPFGRVLALMTGEDDGVVTDLRGLAAWLSAHCLSGRHALIERDPLGVVLYGDVRNFPVSDKRLVLEGMKSESQYYPFPYEDWSSPSFGALGTLNMAHTFREILSSPLRDDKNQKLVDYVLDALRYSERMSALADLLETIARDTSYWPRIRKAAIQALMHVIPDDHSKLLKLAEDIRAGVVEDREDEILGTILDKLYPHTISPARIFDYLHPPKNPDLIRSYFMFWVHHLPENSVREDLPLLLDKLAQIRPDMREVLQEHQLNKMAGILLARGLEAHGDVIVDERLFEWLGVGLDEYAHPRLDGKYTKRIAKWFVDRPDRYKAMICCGASLCVGSDNIPYCMHRSTMRLYGATPPADIETWYLEKAAAEQQVELAEYYFTQAVHLLIQQGGQQDLTLPALEFLKSWTQAYPALQTWLDPFITRPIGDWQQEHAIKNRERKYERQKRKNERVSYYRQHIAAIRDGSAYPQILHDLARAYNGLIYEAKGETPRERLEIFLDGDVELIEAAYTGFRHALDRSDLPTVREIVDLELKGQMHYIRAACLVGMDELYQSDPSGALRLTDDVLSRMLAFRFTNVGDDPSWFAALLRERPALVAEVLLTYAMPMLRAGKEHIAGLYPLVYNDAYAEVARIALPVLLEGFPLRASKLRLSNALDPLMIGALHYIDGKTLASLIARKLELKSMDAAQRVYWLGCGLLVAPAIYEAKLIQYIGKSEVRRGYLASFLHSRCDERRLPDNAILSETTLAHLIELLAPDCSPERTTGAGWVSPAMNTADMVRSYINTLGGNPNETASSELERLLALPNLSPWHNLLRGALHAQRIARRKASFHRLGVAAVSRTLANLQPASAADLAALAFDHLRDIARKIRDGNTDDYEQYWSYDASNKKLDKPKPENDCRDVLLSDLKERLGKLNIDAQREGNYADDKQADIRVSFGGASGFNVPIEIKKDNHRDLWRAIHEQLIAKYVRDPGTDGHGIYLVFWFGGKGMPLPPDGKKLRSAQELEDRLRQTLLPEESHRILVCVIDCALPSHS